MGMAASQARYLNLTSQQTDLEYQAQQINNSRSILSEQVSSLNTTLLGMEVPTPPSTSEYTKITYTGTDGATKFSIGSVKPSGENYSVEIHTETVGHSLALKYGTAVVSGDATTIKGEYVSEVIPAGSKTGKYIPTADVPKVGDAYMRNLPKGSTTESDFGNYYVLGADNKFVKASGGYDATAQYYVMSVYTEGAFFDNNAVDGARDYAITPEVAESDTLASVDSIQGYYVLDPATGSVRIATAADFTQNANGTYTFKAGVEYIKESTNGIEFQNQAASGLTIAGEPAMTWAEAMATYPTLGWDGYEQAINNKFQGDQEITTDSFYVYVTTSEFGVQEAHFALKEDVGSADGRTAVYDYSPNGQYTESKITDGCQLSFDSAGRIASIDIPVTSKNAQGEDVIVAYTTIPLKAETEQDELGYQEAMAKYEYQKFLNEKEELDIELKIKKIQNEDKRLELQLTELDAKRRQITTELEAVKKVVDDNIDKSYKTFNG